MNLATKEYILSLDSDDCLRDDAIQQLKTNYHGNFFTWNILRTCARFRTEGKPEGHGGRIRYRRQKNGTFRRELPEKQIYIRLFHVLSGQGEACRENP